MGTNFGEKFWLFSRVWILLNRPALMFLRKIICIVPRYTVLCLYQTLYWEIKYLVFLRAGSCNSCSASNVLLQFFALASILSWHFALCTLCNKYYSLKVAPIVNWHWWTSSFMTARRAFAHPFSCEVTVPLVYF